MFDSQGTLNWLQALCEQALKEANEGNNSLIDSIGRNPALTHYWNEVFVSGHILPEGWFASAPAFMIHADQLRQAYEASNDAEVREAINGYDRLLAALGDEAEHHVPLNRRRA